MAYFYEMDFMKGIVISAKIDEMYNILKSLLVTGYWLRDEGGIGWSKFLLQSALEYPYVYYVPPLLREMFHLLVIISFTFFFKTFRLSM